MDNELNLIPPEQLKTWKAEANLVALGGCRLVLEN
jgi:hypothetical protein